MKNIPKITRLQLKIDHEEESILLGLVSAEPDYKLSLSINKKLSISLKNATPVNPGDDPDSQIAFSRFTYINGAHDISYNLISNRSGKDFLFKKLKNIDYIFQIHDPEGLNTTESLIAIMREIESVNAVFNIDLLTFKDKNLHYLHYLTH
jgi:hypothetical protein